jgi:hypothetical protein
MAGAMAFGWPYSEEPIYGVTPIREMLEVKRHPEPPVAGGARALALNREIYRNLMAPRLLERAELARLVRESGLARADEAGTARTGLTPLPMSLGMGGVSPAAVDYLRDYLGVNLTAGPGSAAAPGVSAELCPGGTVTIPLADGDINAAVLGTVTDVVGEKVYAFGHGWNAEGAAAWPMATGYVHTFISRNNMSFKLGHALEIVGSVRADEAAGIYGEIGPPPRMIPVEITVAWAQDGGEKTFHTRLAPDERLDGLLTAIVLVGGLMHKGGLPRDHTITYALDVDFEDLPSLSYQNISSDAGPMHLIEETLPTLTLLLNNPWRPVAMKRVRLQATIAARSSLAEFRSVQLDRRLYRPGETVQARAELETLRNGRHWVSLSLPLPDDLPDGAYQVNIGSSEQHRQQLQATQPHRYMAFCAADVQRILQERLSLARSDLYLSLALPGEGLALAEESLPDLPGSRTLLLNDPSRKTLTANFAPLAVAQVKTDFMLLGGETFSIEVRR